MPLQYTHGWTVDETDNPRIVDQSDQVANGLNRIRVWCKGLKIDARVEVAQHAAEPGKSWAVGLIQILEDSKMEARYGDTIVEWRQEHLPCYDSTKDACVPWYTANTQAQILGASVYQLSLLDYPTTHLDPYWTSLGGQQVALTHYVKHNKFNAYLALCTDRNGQKSYEFLKHCRCETRVEFEPEPGTIGDAAKMYVPDGYRELDHSRRASWIYKPITARFHSLPATQTGSANEHIQRLVRSAAVAIPVVGVP